MNREHWQQKRGRTGAPQATSAMVVVAIADSADVKALASGAARPAPGAGGPDRAEVPAVAVRPAKP